MSSAKHENPSMLLERALEGVEMEGRGNLAKEAKSREPSVWRAAAATSNQSAEPRLVARHFQSLHSLLLFFRLTP